MKSALDPLKLLRQTLDDRCKTNPQYSIRAFAKASGISHTVLSLVLSGKRNLSKKATGRLADYLNLDPTTRKSLMQNHSNVDQAYESLSLDSFELISDWYHYGILSVLELPNSSNDPKWIANQLGIKPLQAKMALDRLKRLGLIQQMNDGSLKQGTAPLKIDNTHSTSATKKFHKQLLVKAAESIDKDPVSDRDFSSMTFTMHQSQVEYARKRIQTFRRELTAELERKGKPEAVFNLMIQLYPVTPLTKTEKK
jgi:uncharacterized protein (TIGR02147 family)